MGYYISKIFDVNQLNNENTIYLFRYNITSQL
jgi:hypothetical protein